MIVNGFRITGRRPGTIWRYEALGRAIRLRRMSRGVRPNSALNTSLKWQVLRNPFRCAISEIATRSQFGSERSERHRLSRCNRKYSITVISPDAKH